MQPSAAAASPSSRGLGHRPFTAVTGVRIPLGTPISQELRTFWRRRCPKFGRYRCPLRNRRKKQPGQPGSRGPIVERNMSRFSQLYIERGLRASDSARARRRLNAILTKLANEEALHRMALRITEEQGCNIPVFGSKPKTYYFTKFFYEIDIRDMLDAITAIFLVFSDM